MFVQFAISLYKGIVVHKQICDFTRESYNQCDIGAQTPGIGEVQEEFYANALAWERVPPAAAADRLVNT